jgi:hypothetical protein
MGNLPALKACHLAADGIGGCRCNLSPSRATTLAVHNPRSPPPAQLFGNRP